MREGMDLCREKKKKAVPLVLLPLYKQLSFKQSSIADTTFCDDGNILYVTVQYGSH